MHDCSHAEGAAQSCLPESASEEALDVRLEATVGLWAAVQKHWIEHARSSALLSSDELGRRVLRKVMRQRRVRQSWARSGDMTADVACGAAWLLQVQVEGAVL